MTRPYPWKCRVCREQSVRPTKVDYTAEMKHDGRTYTVTVPGLEILECEACHAQTLPDEADEKLTDALRREVGLLMPAEISEKRAALGLSQKALADHLRVAAETVNRWERGGQIQQRAMDLLLRAYFDLPELRQFLENLAGAERAATFDSSIVSRVPARDSLIHSLFPEVGQGSYTILSQPV